MPSQYHSNAGSPADSLTGSPLIPDDDKINITEWLVIITVLVAATIGYVYYYSAHQQHEAKLRQSAIDQPIAAGIASSATSQAPPPSR